MPEINISGLDKVALLKNMWMSTSCIGLGFLGGGMNNFDSTQAPTAVKRYIDYYQGRPIKSDLSGDTVDSYLYDRDSSVPLATIVAQMRQK